MSGWSFERTDQVINEWQCTNVTMFYTDGYLVMRSVSDFIQFVTSRYYAYLCLKMTEITPNSYRYYIYEPQQPELGWDRYLVHPDGTLSAVENLCYESYGASGAEYKMMIKSGSESSIGITCPWIFLGSFDYTYISVSGTVSCDTTDDTWTMCINKQQMMYDYNTCPIDVSYSDSTTVSCIDSVPVGEENYITTFNPGSYDGVNTFQFSCFAVNNDLTTVSVAPGHCRHGQTSTEYPVDTSQNDAFRNNIGALIELTTVKVTCPELLTPDGGSVSIETNGAITIATYTCEAGYALYGDSVRTCQENNTWTSQPPTCKCEAPVSPDNGIVDVSSDGSIATYSCNIGYVLKGNQYRGCQVDGNAWNGTDPICETCSSLTSLLNGVISYTVQGLSTVAIFTCNVGYSLNGVTNITCLDDGTWSNSKPDCIECGTLTTPSLGNITYSTDGLNTLATFTCDTGYKVLGVDTLTCSSDSTWDQLEPSCKACSNFQSPSGGNVSMTTNGTHTTGSVSCDLGYTLAGDSTIQCYSDGSWSFTDITCVICETIEPIDSGNVTMTTNGSVSTVVYTCSDGYVLVGSSIRQCKTDGTWDGQSPICECEDTGAPINGNITIIDDTRYYTCRVNYTLSGSHTSVCSNNGSGLSHPVPLCDQSIFSTIINITAVACEDIQMISGGRVQLLSAGLYTQSIFSCDLGYTLVGTNSTVCDSSGLWNDSIPYCQICDSVDTPANGSIIFTSDGIQTTVQYSCDVGFTIVDISAVYSQCQHDGSWNIAPTTCVSCDNLDDISSGSITMVTNGTTTTAVYTCTSGYNLVGESVRECLYNGTWTLSTPQCVCESPPSIDNGYIVVSEDGMSVEYRCNTGYTMNGTSYVICQHDNLGWNGTAPICVTCSDLNAPSNGAISVATDGKNSIATYSCNVGYSLNGALIDTCLSDGTWNDEPPVCVLCDEIASPDSGSMVQNATISTTIANFQCMPGYYLDGDMVIACNSDGSWNNTEPTCVCDPPSSPINGSIHITDNGMTAIYICDIGYTLNGDGRRTCQSQVTCDALDDIQSGALNYTSNGTHTEVTYSCNTGYTMMIWSDTVLTSNSLCDNNGQWNIPNITCVECEVIQSPHSGTLELLTDGYVTEALFECTGDYYMIGESTLACNTSGLWSSSPPSCVCIPPSSIPDHGAMNISTDNMTVTFTCNPGYTLIGSSARNCSIDGTGWSGQQPICESCDTLSTPDNGSYTLITDGIVTQAIFSCNVGNIMNGMNILTCQSDRTWDYAEPECNICSSLVEPLSGSLSLSTNGTISIAVFSCMSNYHIVGDDTLLCNIDTTWSHVEPSCVCDEPTRPANGNITLSSDGMAVYYQCNNGYTLSGHITRICSDNGTGWLGSQPTCVSCPPISSPIDGSLALLSNGTQTTAYFTCDLGYTMNGLASLTCNSDGQWSTDTPSCVQCASLGDVDSGSVTMTTDGEQTMATYTCVDGYILYGQSESICQTDVCSAPSTPDNGHISYNGTVVSYTCNVGYTLKGVDTRICQSNGAGWNENQPACVTCEALTNPSGASLNTITTGTSTITYVTCLTGYTILGSSVLTCRSDGTWDIAVPTCVVCDTLSTPSAGTVDLYSNDSITMANFSCNLGYTLSGKSTLECRSDGNWDFTEPDCVLCEDVMDIMNGNTVMTTNGETTKLTITCENGYYIIGQSELKCNTDGKWDYQVPLCVCDPPNIPSNGSYVVSDNGMTITYSCDIGFTFVGDYIGTCMQDGSGWNISNPTCVGCPVLPSSHNGSNEVISDGITTVLSVTCGIGTTISTTGTLTCTSNGSWSMQQPTCVSCPVLDTVENGHVTMVTDGDTSIAIFNCDVGYSINTTYDTIVCLNNGTWSNSFPHCVHCKTISDISSGYVVYATNGTSTTVLFSCNDGYYIDGNSNSTCTSDGDWNTDIPVCVCESPASPINGSIWISEDGMTVQYYCNSGYTINGPSNNTCLQDGTGWISDNPVCVECQARFAPVNGDQTIYTDGEITYSVITCDAGYSLNMEYNILTCNQNGIWSNDYVECVQCENVNSPFNGYNSISTNGTVTIVTYTCMSGYYLIGNAVSFCMNNGTWSDNTPVCVCDSPVTISNGEVTLSADLYIASYTCYIGFALNGVAERQCLDDGTGWSGQEPTCVTCNTLETITGGLVQLFTDGIYTYGNYTCSNGYSMNGEATIQCRNDGTWNFNPPTCETCLTLVVDPAGTYTTYTDGIYTNVIYKCDVGYTLVGSSTATCSSTGVWSSLEPSCVACESLGTLDSGNNEFASDGKVTTASFTCVTGYNLVGEEVSYCQNDGTWNTSFPICVCDMPSAPDNGSMVISDDYFSVYYVCDTGYVLNGDNYMVCGSDGSGWNGTTPECKICDDITTPTNGSISISSDGIQTFMSISCETGFTSSGVSTLTCLADGSYDLTVPTCVSCDTIMSPDNGNISYDSNGTQTIATITCNTGYTLYGKHVIYCLQDGSWSDVTPTCEPCQTVPTITSGIYDIQTNGTMTYVSIQCDNGYIISGPDNIYCDHTGQWSDYPSCVCVGPVAPVNGEVNSTGLIATFTCNTGYTLDGYPISICRNDSSGWLTQIPVCGIHLHITISIIETMLTQIPFVTMVTEIPVCGIHLHITISIIETMLTQIPVCGIHLHITISIIETMLTQIPVCGIHLHITISIIETMLTQIPVCVKCEDISDMDIGTSTKFTSVMSSQTYIQYTCPIGYTLDGMEYNYCNIDGTWSNSVPTCVHCEILSVPSNGIVDLQTDNVTTTALYSCVDGYHLVGSSNRTCSTNGTWASSQTLCVCNHPGSLDNGNVTITTDDLTSIYTCNIGYTISGPSTRTCSDDGSGWSDEQPSCVLCDTLATSSGVKVTLATDGLTTIATYTCSEGFSLNGEASVACRNDGTWNTTVPSCVLCDSLESPINGAYTLSTDGAITMATFTCDNGYTLKGSSILICDIAGRYLLEEPTCSLCNSLVTPDSSIMEINTNGTITTAVVTCLPNYNMIGDSYLVCSDDGTWDNTQPECFCDPPDDIMNGYYNISTDNLSVIYTCLEGFTLDGDIARYCMNDGLGWNGTTPSCVTCNTVSVAENGTIVTSTNGTVTTATVSCNIGSVLIGEPSIECFSNGSWTLESFSCVTCETLFPPTHATMTMRTNDVTSLYDITCNNGYTLSGSATLTCLEDGTWSDQVPTCVSCPTVDNIDNGEVLPSSNGLVTTLSFICHTGYTMVGSDNLYCRVDGTWNDSVPICVCNSPLSVIDGNFTISNNGMIVTYTCNVGYTMIGESVRYCTTNSTGWTGNPPVCVKCDDVVEPLNGNVTMTTDGLLSYITYSCNLGYSLYGEVAGTCDQTGNWNINTPTCLQCEEIETINNGDVVTTSNGSSTIATYTCVTDYYLEGNTELYCTEGVWIGSLPTCLCSSPTHLDNGDFDSNGTLISYACNVGYTLNGIDIRQCLLDGTGWNGNEPTCEKCNTLAMPSGGNVKLTTDGISTTASFTCSVGYTLSGNTLLTCMSDGTWDLSSPSCGISCSAIGSPDNGVVVLSTDGYTTQASFSCIKSYSLKGSSVLTCRNDGTWDLIEPTCEQCSVLYTPNNGYMNITTDGISSIVTFSCHYGYYIVGENTLSCSSNGVWNGTEPRCVCVPPNDITNGYMNITEDGLQIQYACASGYSLVGDITIYCQDDYIGWTSNDTQCVSCGDTPFITNGVVTMVTDGITTSITITCNTGYSIHGQSVIQCGTNGTWTEQLPECVSCPVLDSIIDGSMYLQSDGYTTYAMYDCDLGFSINGDVNITCLNDSSWNTLPPICVCNSPVIPENGNIIISTDEMIAIYSCQTGYSLNGNHIRGCNNESSGWNGTDPGCVPCMDISPIINGAWAMSTDGLTSMIQYSCHTGFTLHGDTSLTCNSSGYWSNDQPQCVQCEDVDSPNNGDVTISTNGSISIAAYMCDSMYHLVGYDTSLCLDNGTWSVSMPSCVCDNPTEPINGHVTSDGYVAIYTCDLGYTLYGEYKRLCQNDSSGWNGTQPTCVTCEPLTSLAGGTVTMETNGLTTSVVYTCDTGYTVSGTNYLQCRSDGTWDFSSPTCVTCDTLSIPNNGDVTLISDDSITQAIYTCNIGYSLSGTSILTCRSSGTWDFTEPTCVQCDTYETINSGSVTMYTNGINTYNNYTCTNGYYIVGDIQRQCNNDGLWSGSTPSCKCIPLNAPGNGTMILDDNNETTMFTCNVGYSMVGNNLITCNNDGSSWNGTTPLCVGCGDYITPSNSTINYTTDGLTSSLTISCEVGTSLIGSEQVYCGTTGVWEMSDIPQCVTCEVLLSVENGSTILDSDGTITQATFLCNIGTSMIGPSHIQCINGSWNDSPPICETCPTIQSTSSSYDSLILSTNGYITELTVTCIQDYTIVGNATVQCHDGIWNSNLPPCVCDILPPPSNGLLMLAEDRMSITYTCNNGYTLNGSHYSVCNVDGTGWNTSVPECIQCNSLNNIEFGSYTIYTNGTESYVEYACQVGYTLNGDSERYCNYDGEWFGTDPSCVRCPDIEAPYSGYVNLQTNNQTTIAIYSCTAGYLINGTTQRTCLSNGTWTLDAPTCYCDIPASPSYGSVQYSSNREESIFSCISGYTLKGYSSSYCLNDGTGWNTSSPECVLCDTLTVSSGMIYNISTDGVTSTAIFECEVGYTIQGETILTCRDDGTWNLVQPYCVACDTISQPVGGMVEFITDNTETQAIVTCDIGYSLLGVQTLTCRSDGSWDFVTPSCVSCPAITTIDNGNISISTDGILTTVLYTCSEGYYLDGTDSIICDIDGTWSDLSPLCKCIHPDVIDNGSMVLSDNDMVASFTCDVGFSLNGFQSLVCQSNSQGWDHDLPNCVECDTLFTISNGGMNITTNGTSTMIQYTCDPSFTLSGASELTCNNDGTWSFDVPLCVPCENITSPTNGSYTWVTNGLISEVMFECSPGYSLTGSTSLTCSTTGIVDGDVPSCAKCAELTQPINGMMTIESNGTISYAVHTCNPDYSLIGNSVIECMNGVWMEQQPYCECTYFNTPSNGDLEISSNGSIAMYTCNTGYTMNGISEQTCSSQSLTPICVQCVTLDNTGIDVNITTDGITTLAIYTCNTGYTMVGQSIIQCRYDGTWSTSSPTCVSCATLDIPNGGTIDMYIQDGTTYANIQCLVDYTLSGKSTISCKTDGSWDFGLPDCVKCADIISPSAGNMSISTNGTVTMATFSCMGGYYSDDEMMAVCQVDGTWSTTSPTCVCDLPSAIQNGSLSVTNDNMIASYTCDIGYTLQGEITRYCDSTGNGWSGEDPVCNSCPDLTEQTNGSITMYSDGITTSVYITCQQGFSISDTSTMQCLSNGTWTVQQPSCVECEDYEDISSGRVLMSSNGTQSILLYTCDVGYTLYGTTYRSCLQNGTWDKIRPHCVQCSDLSQLENGMITMETNSTVSIARFECDENYQLIGTDVITCTDNGTWEDTLPSCICSTFESLENGALEITDNGTKAIYTCNTGFTLSGDPVHICGELAITGDTFVLPVCVQCETLSVSSDVNIHQITDGIITTATFQCPSGSTLNGLTNITCRNDGTWDFNVPSCVSCAALSVSIGGNVTIETDGQLSVAIFTCNIGYTLSGQSMLTCNSDGIWNFVEPTCVECESLSSPSSGTVNISTDGITTTAIYNCISGYYIVGTSTLTCLETGVWDHSPPICVCDPPSDIDNGNFSLSNNGMVATYVCYINYTMTGDSVLYCDTAGKGFLGETPTCSQCLPLSDVTNGTISIISDGINTMAIYTCNEGYTITDTSIIQCQSNGEWNFDIQPTCERCTSLLDIDNGTIVISTNGTVTYAEYNCSIGYTLHGSLSRICSHDGTWTDVDPICVQCGILEDIENGYITMIGNGSVTIATFLCHQDYTLNGDDVLYCTTTGAWTSSVPTCICTTFGELDGGDIVIKDNGTTALYSCDVGSTLYGEHQQICGIQTSTGNNYNVPTCVTCDTLPSSSFGTFELTTDGITTIAIYQCPVSYTMIGSANLTCRTDGTWDISPPSCQSCSTLSVFTDGNIDIISNGEQTQAVFTCDTGTTLAGESIITCNADGSWNFEQPVCVSCPTLSAPTSGYMNLSTDGITSKITYKCMDGYYLDGETILRCTETGHWDFDKPSCKCEDPDNLINGTVTISDDRNISSYQCNHGYSLYGDSVRYCTQDGNSWSGDVPLCVKCLPIQAGSNQSVTMTTDGITTSVEFYCDVGTSMIGKQTLSCLPDGTWDGSNPTCVACPSLTDNTDVNIQLNTDGITTTLTYQCDIGSTLVGQVQSTCLTNSTWSDNMPSCVECPNLSNPNNGDVSTVYNGSVTMATFICDEGYTLVGDDVITCLQTGTWSNNVPTCNCTLFSTPLNGNLEISDDGTSALYTCDEGYSMTGEPTQSCSLSDNNLDVQPSCVPCDSLSISEGLSLNTSTDGQLTIAMFTCKIGYTMIGNNILTCRSDGSWNYNIPTCVSCETLGSPVGGNLTLKTNGLSTTATVMCVEGFTVVGESLLTCKDDGMWNFDIPFCECNAPMVPDNGYITISEDSRTVYYHCNIGYTLSGSNIRYCSIDGTWWTDDDPSCVQCPGLTPTTGMNISFIHYDNIAQTIFTCDIGYTLSHTENVTCLQNGSWSTARPYCVKTQSITNEQNACEDPDSSVAIAFGVLFGLAVIVIAILSLLLWRFWRRNKNIDGQKPQAYHHPPIDSLKNNPLFSDIDRASFIPSRAPTDYSIHVTNLGRADTSLAPTSHHKHIMGEGAFTKSAMSAPLTTRNIELQHPPTRPPTIGGRRSPVTSVTPSSLRESSLDHYMTDQLLTLREDTSISSAVVEVPKLIIPDKTVKKGDKEKSKSKDSSTSRKTAQRKSPMSSFLPVKETVYREGSPLPQQILTPRNADDIHEETVKQERIRKPKGDLIDQDKNLLKVYKHTGKRSAGQGRKSPKLGNVSVTDIENDVEDIDV
ncbi:Sushi [Mactra antiquata]